MDRWQTIGLCGLCSALGFFARDDLISLVYEKPTEKPIPIVKEVREISEVIELQREIEQRMKPGSFFLREGEATTIMYKAFEVPYYLDIAYHGISQGKLRLTIEGRDISLKIGDCYDLKDAGITNDRINFAPLHASTERDSAHLRIYTL